jgi:hypothetical protein
MDQFFRDNPWVLTLMAIWALPWKGWSLWKSAKNDDKIWFIALLVTQTVGILDILYIFVFSRKKLSKSKD